MNDRPLASVVVPFRDSERHIAPCVESLLGQTGVDGPYEIILIDNGSTDRSAAIVAAYDGPLLLAEQTPGAYAARNTGIRAARAPVGRDHAVGVGQRDDRRARRPDAGVAGRVGSRGLLGEE